MKGQAFIILATLLILIFFLIKNLSQLNLILEEEIERHEFENLKQEIFNTFLFSKEIPNISSNLEDFLKFSKNSFASRGKTLRFFVVEVYYPKIIANQKTVLNVSVVNFLGYDLKILNITFSYDNSSSVFYGIKDGEKVRTNFSFNINSPQAYELQIFYENRSEKIYVLLEIDKSKFLVFSQIQFENSFKIEDKFSISKELS